MVSVPRVGGRAGGRVGARAGRRTAPVSGDRGGDANLLLEDLFDILLEDNVSLLLLE